MKLQLLFLFIGLTQILSAQSFTEISPASEFHGVHFSSIAFTDVDGDGDEDVLITGFNNSFQKITKLYHNNGMGSFTEVTGTPFDNAADGSITFTDVDGDGDKDVLITGQNSSFQKIAKLYTNSGMGTFTEVMDTPFEGVEHGSIAFSDVDGDGDEDLLITGRNGSDEPIAKLYTNNGMGTFTEVMDTPFDGVAFGSIAFSDVDGDGDEDVLITGGNISGERIAKLYTNDGMGTFSEVTDKLFDGVERSVIAFSDVDCDRDEDVLITGRNSSFQRIAKLYTNNGMGTFTEVTDTPFDSVDFGSIAFSDVDRDGDEDVLITGGVSSSQRIAKLYTNNGMGTFTEVTDTLFDGVAFSSIDFSDVDGDGDEDVLITGRNDSSQNITKLYTNDGVVDSLVDISLNLNLYPNPAVSNTLNVSFKASESNPVSVQVYDSNGRLISQQKELVGTGKHTLAVDITSLSPGSYFIQLKHSKRSGMAKFIIP